MKTVSPQSLHDMLLDGQEIALADVREINPYSKGHLLFAIPLPLGRLEILVADLIPRKNARVVLCDKDGKLAERAANRMTTLGYTNVAVLDGGVKGWQAAGFEVFFNPSSNAGSDTRISRNPSLFTCSRMVRSASLISQRSARSSISCREEVEAPVCRFSTYC